jgi:hypothetical protein
MKIIQLLALLVAFQSAFAQLKPVKLNVPSVSQQTTNNTAITNINEAEVQINQLKLQISQLNKTIAAIKPLLPVAYGSVNATLNNQYGTIDYKFISNYGFQSQITSNGDGIIITLLTQVNNPVVSVTSAYNRTPTGKPQSKAPIANYTIEGNKILVKLTYTNETVNVMADFSIVVYEGK